MADCDGVFASNTTAVDDTPIPDWFALDLDLIYEQLNPRTKQGTSQS
jgi:hypothetical protein